LLAPDLSQSPSSGEGECPARPGGWTRLRTSLTRPALIRQNNSWPRFYAILTTSYCASLGRLDSLLASARRSLGAVRLRVESSIFPRAVRAEAHSFLEGRVTSSRTRGGERRTMSGEHLCDPRSGCITLYNVSIDGDVIDAEASRVESVRETRNSRHRR